MRAALLFFALSFALVAPASLAQASADQVIPWTEAVFTTQAPAPYGRVQVTLRLEGDGRLADLTIGSDRGGLRVPRVAFADVSRTQVASVKVTFKTGFDGNPWLFVHIPFGSPVNVRGGTEWQVAVIAFQGDRAVYRALSIPRPDGGFDWQPSDLPRE